MRIEAKKENKPVFRGRFGTRSKRKKSIAKWDRWRVPQGIDISWKRGDGNRPKVGYKVCAELRGLHPKGKKEFMIRSRADIDNFDKKEIENYVFRFEGTIGIKKKEILVKLAESKGMCLLNPKIFAKKKSIKKTPVKVTSEKKSVDKKVSEKKTPAKKKEISKDTAKKVVK